MVQNCSKCGPKPVRQWSRQTNLIQEKWSEHGSLTQILNVWSSPDIEGVMTFAGLAEIEVNSCRWKGNYIEWWLRAKAMPDCNFFDIELD